MLPAPIPRGTARSTMNQMFGTKAKPSSASAVSRVLKAATLLVPNRLISRVLSRLEIMVPQDTVTLTKLP